MRRSIFSILVLTVAFLLPNNIAEGTSLQADCAAGGELMDQTALPANGGALALWKSYVSGGYCAEATGSAIGTVAIENIEGTIVTFAVKSQPGTIVGTNWVGGLIPIRGVFNGEGHTTVTQWHSSV